MPATENGWCFEWKDGALVPFDFPEAQDQRDDEDFPDWFGRIGYDPDSTIGNRDGHCLGVWHRRAGDGYPYLALLSTFGSYKVIFLPSFDALLRLQALVMPTITAASIEEEMGELTELARKAFRAWHGHDRLSVCQRCDPAEYRRLQDASRRHEEARAAKK